MMRIVFFYISLVFFTGLSLRLSAQVAWLRPASPGIDDSVTLFFNAAEGNASLKGYTGDVYLHTGVITSKSLDGHDWKYVVGNWGTVDPRVLMKRELSSTPDFDFCLRKFFKFSRPPRQTTFF